MKSIYLAAALLLGAFAFAPAPASAAPATVLNIEGLFTASPVIEAQYRDRRRSRARHNYRAGQRYDRAPRGWRRYDRRPGNWRDRNCVLVGPVWFCP